jgi:GNAT superfamily N-acetyltransferase
VDDLEIRPAGDEELTVVAALRWQWVLENGARPATSRGLFIEDFVRWARENDETHWCLVAVRDGVVLGMAWLATIPRVPTPQSLERRSGDVQCVYVVPEERNGGVGGRLIDEVLAPARTLGLERVTVHSSDRAVAAYRRRGFAGSARLLQVVVRP